MLLGEVELHVQDKDINLIYFQLENENEKKCKEVEKSTSKMESISAKHKQTTSNGSCQNVTKVW